MIGLTEATGSGIILTIADSEIDTNSVLDVSDYDTDLDALKTEVGGYITSVKNNPDKTLTKKLGELYAEKGFKEKTADFMRKYLIKK